ncbi:transporter substrate-binding domain-containing protein [Margalitia sp. FSL K6-0131]|uniref:transporter substrate-binding domain-containing protein n=1 Tax=Margalitia sp. FSL K6-0131 TaxID=2954604 RepID=UPI0030F5E005
MRYLCLILLFITVLLFPSFSLDAKAKEVHVIRVGFDKDAPPLSYLGPKGEASGFEIELIQNIATQQGYKIKFFPLELDDAIEMLKEGKLDLIAGLEYTSTRDTFFDFSDTYLTIPKTVVIPSSIRDISSVNDLKGKVVAVQRDDTVISQLENIRGSEMLETFNQLDAMDMLFLGRADVFLGNRPTVEYILQHTKNRMNYRVRTGLIPPSDYAFAVREGNYKLLKDLNNGLAALHRNGTYERLYSQYLEPYGALEIGWWRKLVYILLILTGVIFAILVGIFYWNKRLKKEVNRQTAALADSYAFQSKVLDSVDNGILSFNPRGSIILINHIASNLLGIRGNPSETNIFDFLPQLPLQKVMEIGEQRMLHGEIHLDDGTDRILQYYIASLQNGIGEIVGGILCIQDRTEQKHLQARLIAQEKMRALGQLVAGIAHEIRNPLTAIKTFTEMLPRKINDPRFQSELVQHVPEEVERMNRIIEDLLDYSREKSMNLEWINLNELVQSITGLFKKQFHNEGIETEIHIPTTINVLMDPNRIKQVLINLVLNATQAMKESKKKQLRFHAAINKQLIQVDITDSGVGIKEQDIPHLFQPFYTTKSQGIGLGLYICQKIMQEHGGHIEVNSTKYKGTTFTLFFINGGDAS